jgi:fructokinase
MAIRTVYCIGETVLDLIFRTGMPLAATPGGSMLNTAVSLGRTGYPVTFISDFGLDRAGNYIEHFLGENGVNTNYTDRFSDGKTALGLAFLDAGDNAEYSFYKVFPKKRMNILFPEVTEKDIVLFGSYFPLVKEVRKRILPFIRKARSAGALIIYDPNFRKPHLPELPALRPWIRENISLSDIVRGSNEDFLHIFGTRNAAGTYEKVRASGCNILIYTKNNKGVEVFCEKKKRAFTVPSLKPVSTIGAGDGFNAGLIHAILSSKRPMVIPGQGRWSVPHESWSDLIGSAIAFAGNVCLSHENYISPEFAKTLKHA